MIKQLSIQNFKSVRRLDMSCRRVNVFIGEPNAGKTNVLEAMGLRCRGCLMRFNKVFRAASPADLFFDQDSTQLIGVGFDNSSMLIRSNDEGLVAVFPKPPGPGGHLAYLMSEALEVAPHTIALDDEGKAAEPRYYLFSAEVSESQMGNGSLLPPFGDNILNLLYSNK